MRTDFRRNPVTNLTILMPVYNAMPYLPEAVDSIRRQTLRDWRFVILNDGSTDGTARYLDQLNDPRIRVLHGPNVGLGPALNRGLQLCTTEFLARMDGDDIAHPTRLEEQFALLRRRPEVGLVGTQIERFGETRTGSRSLLPCDHSSIVSHLMDGRAALYHPTVMCRTKLMKEIGGYMFDSAAQDWDMLLRMGERAELANLDRVLLSFRVHAGSVTVTKMAEAHSRIASACECARRRQSAAPAIDYEEFMAARRAAEAVEVYARRQYRLAVGEMLGSRPVLGRLRLAWAATCSPRLTRRRVFSVLHHRRPRWGRSPARTDAAVSSQSSGVRQSGLVDSCEKEQGFASQ